MPAPIVHNPPGVTNPNAPAAAPKALQAVRNAKIALGKPYIWGGTNLEKGVDCSGLCFSAYSLAGVSIPRTSQAQYAGLNLKVPKGSEIPGDLIFSYMNEGGVSGPGHVVMSIGNGEVIAADHTGSVVHIEKASVFDSVYVGSRRVVPYAGAITGKGGLSFLPGASSIESAASGIGSALSTLSDPHTWFRVGQVILGFILSIVAIYVVIKKGS